VPCPRLAEAASQRPGRPLVEIADVFHARGEAYRQSHRLSGDQLRAMRAIEACRTEVLGGHLDVCPACALSKPSYNSCRNRHCPKCQSLSQARWIEARMERVLPVPYFHVVCTLPAQLRPIARRNPAFIFDLLFASSAQALLDLGDDPKRLGARLGVTSVLHTWTRELDFHPHVHSIVTGGGLAPEQDRWLAARSGYLFPVKVLGKLFRGKFLDGLVRAHRNGKLALDGTCYQDPAALARVIDQLYATNWVVYSKAPFAGPDHVYRYLGRYTHRVGISNQRLQSFDGSTVRFATKDGKSISLDADEFIRRFLQHILPAGFVKIRHFGLNASGNVNTRLVVARRLLDKRIEPTPAVATTPATRLGYRELLLRLTGVDPALCPRCGELLERRPIPRDTS
jgi:Putative transposase/Transposase zinc-binding domain